MVNINKLKCNVGKLVEYFAQSKLLWRGPRGLRLYEGPDEQLFLTAHPIFGASSVEFLPPKWTNKLLRAIMARRVYKTYKTQYHTLCSQWEPVDVISSFTPLFYVPGTKFSFGCVYLDRGETADFERFVRTKLEVREE